MAEKFLLPDPGEGIYEADILEVYIEPGDSVKDGDPLFSVETDKAIIDIPSSFDGTIETIEVGAGDVVEVGAVLLTYAPFNSATHSEADQPAAQAETAIATAPAMNDREDSSGKPRPVPASPATRSLAKHLGVDLFVIEGSGPDGLIEPGDVQAAAGEKEPPPERQPQTATRQPEPQVASEETGVEWINLRGVRRATARQMARSWAEIPHVTHQDYADITELDRFRREHAGEVEEAGGKLSVTAFLVKAAAATLARYPRFNAIIDTEYDRIGLKSEHNIGVAVDTEDGLIVPVIRDVERKSIVEIATVLPELAQRMRDGDRSLDDIKGGTFTITNIGAIGGTGFTPIINHPEVAILGAATAHEVPVFVDGELVPRLHLPLVLAFDHRVNDGADAARFVNTLKGLLEDPARLALWA